MKTKKKKKQQQRLFFFHFFFSFPKPHRSPTKTSSEEKEKKKKKKNQHHHHNNDDYCDCHVASERTRASRRTMPRTVPLEETFFFYLSRRKCVSKNCGEKVYFRDKKSCALPVSNRCRRHRRRQLRSRRRPRDDERRARQRVRSFLLGFADIVVIEASMQQHP